MSFLFAETLRKLRTAKGLSQQDLAERMFVTRTAVVRWETGLRLPDILPSEERHHIEVGAGATELELAILVVADELGHLVEISLPAK